MTALVLDTGALIALDRNDRTVWAMLRNAADDSAPVSVPAGVIAQAWRDGSRQALLARALPTATRSRSRERWHAPPGCCADSAGTADIVDASVALVAAARSQTGPTALVTSDPTDLRHLLRSLGASARLVAV
jgi:hypothetical protein